MVYIGTSLQLQCKLYKHQKKNTKNKRDEWGVVMLFVYTYATILSMFVADFPQWKQLKYPIEVTDL